MPASRRTKLCCLASTAVAICATVLVASACRKLMVAGPETSMGDVEANLEQLIEVTKHGLRLEVSPRFLTFGPLPSEAPWDKPVQASKPVEAAQGHPILLKAGNDGLLRERYEARPCPLREIWSCVELWATGKFGKGSQLACVGLRLEKGDTIEKKKLAMRVADNCPFMTAGSSPAQQVLRGTEKAQLEHAKRQEADKHLDPTSP